MSDNDPADFDPEEGHGPDARHEDLPGQMPGNMPGQNDLPRQPIVDSGSSPFRQCTSSDEASPGNMGCGDVVLATVIEPTEIVTAPDPLWPAFVVVIGAFGAAIFFSTIALLATAAITGNIQTLVDAEARTAWITDLTGSSAGLAVFVLPGQIAFAAFALGAAFVSRERWVDRLGLRAGRLPVWTWPLFLVGTPIIGMLGGQLMSGASDEPSESLKMLERMLQFNSVSSLIVLLLLISLLPGIVEELLFRGFLQRRLLTRLPASVAIVICSVFFAAAHMDPMHALGVLPLGLWLGVVAWRADSIWPAIFGHIGNNGYAIVLSKALGTDPSIGEVNPSVVIVLGVSLLAFAGCLVVLTDRLWPRKDSRAGAIAQQDAIHRR